GEGGIFVDQNGIFQTDPTNPLLRASFGAMVTKSRNAIVTLPSNAIFFAPRMGLADWKLTFTIPEERIIVPAGATFGDYTFDWANLRKNYCVADPNVPYELPATLPANQYPAVTTANLTGLPVV